MKKPWVNIGLFEAWLEHRLSLMCTCLPHYKDRQDVQYCNGLWWDSRADLSGPETSSICPGRALNTARCGPQHCPSGRVSNGGCVLLQTELNRVKGKPPYKELKGEGSINAQADEAWDYGHSRSNSVIQDIFAGQLQSTLQCPACGALSHTFDEFMDLSLPLPQTAGLSVRSPTCTIQVH